MNVNLEQKVIGKRMGKGANKLKQLLFLSTKTVAAPICCICCYLF